MKGMKRSVILGLGLAGVLAPVLSGPRPAAAADVFREQSEQTLDPTGWKMLEIENARGTTAVRPSSDGRVHLVAVKVVRGHDSRQSRDLAERIEVTTDRIEDRFLITVHYPQRSDVHVGFWDLFSGIEFPRSELRLDVQAPATLPIRLRSTSGDFSTEGRSGPQLIDTHSGDVVIHGARGPIDVSTTSGDLRCSDISAARIRTTSGDITIEGVRGPLDARATSGDLVVKSAQDSMRLSTTSGDMRVDTAPRGLTASSMSGDIDAPDVAGWALLSTSSGDLGVGLRAPLKRADASTMNGSIRLRLAPGLGCSLDARTATGTIDVALPMALSQADRHHVIGRLAGGGPPVMLHSGSGDIDVLGGGK